MRRARKFGTALFLVSLVGFASACGPARALDNLVDEPLPGGSSHALSGSGPEDGTRELRCRARLATDGTAGLERQAWRELTIPVSEQDVDRRKELVIDPALGHRVLFRSHRGVIQLALLRVSTGLESPVSTARETDWTYGVTRASASLTSGRVSLRSQALARTQGDSVVSAEGECLPTTPLSAQAAPRALLCSLEFSSEDGTVAAHTERCEIRSDELASGRAVSLGRTDRLALELQQNGDEPGVYRLRAIETEGSLEIAVSETGVSSGDASFAVRHRRGNARVVAACRRAL